MELRILPRNIADMIAAGEVVQRPASVVKELLENAVDAGATQVTVSVTDAGRTLIRVVDRNDRLLGTLAEGALLRGLRDRGEKITLGELFFLFDR